MRPENAAGVASYLPTVPIEHVILASHLVARPHQTRGMSRSKIACVGVTGDEPERGAFTCAGQDERRTWLLYRWWNDPFSLGAVMLAVIRERLRPPDTANDLNRFG